MTENAKTSLPWLLVAALLIHVGEEVWWFPEWATRHFGTTTTAFFLVSHIPIFAIAIWTAWRASRNPNNRAAAWLIVLWVSALVTNVLFHVVTTLWLGEYSPGLATAVLCFLPLAWVLGPPSAKVIGGRSTGLAVVAGFAASVLLAWSLTTGAPGPATPFPSVSDGAYLTSDLWNDGQAEVAFYQVTRSQDQYGRDRDQSFLAGTYLVKHDFDREAGSKATASSTDPVPAFKYALFYEFESRSYEYKRSWGPSRPRHRLMARSHTRF
ncbi:MAG: hypothetical protein ACI9W4_001802 [Rhodothermales bacterium]|jgi:hypothetical protein